MADRLLTTKYAKDDFISPLIEAHHTELAFWGMRTDGHTAIGESNSPDVACAVCGAINKYEYMLAEAKNGR